MGRNSRILVDLRVDICSSCTRNSSLHSGSMDMSVVHILLTITYIYHCDGKVFVEAVGRRGRRDDIMRRELSVLGSACVWVDEQLAQAINHIFLPLIGTFYACVWHSI
jgi:hypothetical protein